MELQTKLTKKVKSSIISMKCVDFLDFTYFDEQVSKALSVGTKHAILPRTCYINKAEFIHKDEYEYQDEENEGNLVTDSTTAFKSHSEFKMLDTQIFLDLESHEDLHQQIFSLHTVLHRRLENSLDKYNYSYGDVGIIQLIIYDIGISTKKFKLNLNSLGESKDLVNSKKLMDNFKLLPQSFKDYNFGVKLLKTIIDQHISSITLLDGSVIDMSKIISKYSGNNIKLLSSIEVYQKEDDIIFVDYKDENNRIINVYNKNGMFISNVEEHSFGSYFIRSIGNTKLYIDNRGVFRKDIDIKFHSVYPYKITGLQSKMSQPDFRFGVLDLETYKNDDISKVYALGFYTKDNMNMFYIEKNMSSDELIMRCLDSMISHKYTGYTFYIHNMTHFDIYFIFKILLSHPEKYQNKVTWRDGTIIGIHISKKIKGKTYSISLVDSLNLLKSDLNTLCKTFGTSVSKLKFPYDFVDINKLFYKGKKPDIWFYDKITLEDYYKIPKENWDLKSETLHYLEYDLLSLFEVMRKFSLQIFVDYRCYLTKSLTISSLAMDIFLRRFYDNNIPLIKQKSVYNDIKKSYYGGVTEVFKPYGENLYHYDVNSLYPFVALNDMPGLECTYTDNINKNIENMGDNMFGFYLCEIVTPDDDYLGLIPTRYQDRLVLGLGNIKGWYFSEELKFAHENGYKIKIISGYTFNRVKDVFTKYIKELYIIKQTTNDPVVKQTVKSLLNNLLGRFGLDIEKYVTTVLTEEELLELLKVKDVKGIKYFEDIGLVIVNHSRDISRHLCTESGLNYGELLFNQNKSSVTSLKEDNYHDVSVAISSAVTSYARIYMNKIKLDIMNKGGNLFYTDTDSLVTDIELDKSLVGNELGQFKLEHIVEKGYYISNKTYAFTTNKKGKTKVIIKSKGLDNENLNFGVFDSLYKGESIIANKYYSKRDFGKGSVTIKNISPVTLDPFSYTKRIKIFENGKWVDTKPIYFNRYHTLRLKYPTLPNLVIWYLICLLFITISYILYNTLCTDLPTNPFIGMEIPETEIFMDEYISPNKNDKNIISKFINLFGKGSYIQNFTSIINNTNDSGIIAEQNYVKDKLGVLDSIYKHNIESSNIEIQQLKEQVSYLKYQCTRYRIDKLDILNEINSIVKDIERDLNIQINKPIDKLTRFSPWNSPQADIWRTPKGTPTIGSPKWW